MDMKIRIISKIIPIMYFLDNAFTLELGKPEYFRVFAIDLLQFFQAPLFCLPLTLKAA